MVPQEAVGGSLQSRTSAANLEDESVMLLKLADTLLPQAWPPFL